MEYICRGCEPPCKVDMKGVDDNLAQACVAKRGKGPFNWVPDVDEQAKRLSCGTSCPMCKRVHDMNMACKKWVEDRMEFLKLVGGEKVQGRRVGKRDRRSPWVTHAEPESTERRHEFGGIINKGRRRVDCP